MRFALVIYVSTAFALSNAEMIDRRNNEEGRLPRRYPTNDSNVKRLNIERRTGFDGKVRKIDIESQDEVPGISAYGLPKKELENNGFIEEINMQGSQSAGRVRNARVVEAYGVSKKRLENNGIIERMPPVVIAKAMEPKDEASRRIMRSIPDRFDKESENDSNDLEAQDAKVFRPLFVYRQQVAKRQKLNKRRNLSYGEPYPQVYRPWVHPYRAY